MGTGPDVRSGGRDSGSGSRGEGTQLWQRLRLLRQEVPTAFASWAAWRVVGLGALTLQAVVTARVLGPAGRGQYVVALITTSGLGELAGGGVWLAPRCRALGANEYEWRRAVRRAGALALQFGLVAGGALGVAYSSFWLGAVAVFAVSATSAAAIARGQAIADKRMRQYVISAVPVPLGAVVATVASGGIGLESPAAALGGAVLAQVAMWRWLLRPWHKQDQPSPDGDLAGGSLRFSSHLALGAAAVLFSAGNRVDYYVLQGYGTAADVGVYSVAVAVAELVLVPHSLLVTFYAAQARHEGARRLRWFLTADLVVTAAVGVVVAVAGPVLTPALFGDVYGDGTRVIPYLLPGLLAAAALAMTAVYLNIYVGRVITSIASSLVNVVVTAGSAIILIPHLGSRGAALGTSAGYAAGLLVAAAPIGVVWRRRRRWASGVDKPGA